MKKTRIIKRAITLFLTLILVLTPMSVVAVNAKPDFLIGDWETDDGIKLSFDSGAYTMQWSGLLQLYESGHWRTGWQSGNTFSITFDGLGLLKIMELLNGILVSNYHFEVLKCNEDNFYLVQVYGSHTAYTSPAKLAFTRVGSQKNTDIPDIPEPEKPDIGDRDELKADDIPVKLHFGGDVEDTIHINWGWEYFLDSAEKYNHNLAMAGLAISQMIHRPESFEYELKHYFGFEDISYEYHSGFFIPGRAFAHKSITVNNQKKHIILVALRGINKDVMDYFNSAESLFEGFALDAFRINDELNEYIGKLGCNKGSTILFITGHSYGGAVAQCLAPSAGFYVSDNSRSFIYTFAAANAYVEVGGYTNVHNIVNVADIVPFIPIGFKKNGRIWYYNSNDKEKYQEYFDKLCKTKNTHISLSPLDTHSAHQPETYFAMMICGLPRDMDSGVQNPYSLTSVECPVDVTVKDMSGNLMGKTVGSTVHLENSSEVFIMVEGESKKILAPPGVKYSLEIVGTGDGTMNIKHQLINLVTGQVTESKEYNDIVVKKGKEFMLDIDGKVTNEYNLEASSQKLSKKSIKKGRLLVLVLVVEFVLLVAAELLLLYVVKRKRK